ncbi:hypothetical protein [Ectobacillus panaciterrae]|uniref:hypothetical protein n=1 Tax=Ectobacillus panaciterrae TaxID=363872 RepID=UPI0004280E58|nr:hypothetical protein [Ectobacillus panaciterrae]
MNSWGWISIIMVVIALMLDYINRINKRLKRTEYKVEQLLKQTHLPEYQINEELRQLVRDNEKIEAIKKARSVLGLSLREAKNYVDSL